MRDRRVFPVNRGRPSIDAAGEGEFLPGSLTSIMSGWTRANRAIAWRASTGAALVVGSFVAAGPPNAMAQAAPARAGHYAGPLRQDVPFRYRGTVDFSVRHGRIDHIVFSAAFKCSDAQATGPYRVTINQLRAPIRIRRGRFAYDRVNSAGFRFGISGQINGRHALGRLYKETSGTRRARCTMVRNATWTARRQP